VLFELRVVCADSNWTGTYSQVAEACPVKILVVQEELRDAAHLAHRLARVGFEANVAADGDEALCRGLVGDYHLIILDVHLRRRSGWFVLGELRRRCPLVPVIPFTARGALRDRVRGLNLGADDYLVRPVAFVELRARVRAVLRRAARGSGALTVADLSIDLWRRTATRADRQLELNPKEFAQLSLLARRAGAVMSLGLIAAEVWGWDEVATGKLARVTACRLRAKVGDPSRHKLIHTVRGVGYALRPPL
jgi:two-component system copper resistance phosphate regulon response regulator CusR